MKKEEILKELEEKFKLVKKELGFKATLDELDEIFFIKHIVAKDKLVSDQLALYLCSKITDLYASWSNYLHSILFPNQSSLVNMSENNMFDEKEKEEMFQFMSEILYFISKNTLLNISRDKKAQGKFIDEALNFWRSSFQKRMIKIINKVNEGWKKKSEEEIK